MIGVIGSGSWATAIIKVLLETPGREVCWWVRRDEVRNAIATSGHNPSHLSDAALDTSRIRLSGDLADVVNRCSHLVLVIPSAYIASVLDTLPPSAYVGKRFVSAIKGAVPEYSTSVSMYLHTQLGVPVENICVVSGPTHAEEVVRELPAFLAVASESKELADEVSAMLDCSYMRAVTTEDIVGVEIAGLMKNVYAIGAGLCQGVGFGDNLTAVYVTAAYAEMFTTARLLSPDRSHDMALYCYLGDLMVTCWSEHSRNRRLGYLLGKEMPVDQIFATLGTVPEGYYSARIVHQHNQSLQGALPLSEAVYRILYEGSHAQTEMQRVISFYL